MQTVLVLKNEAARLRGLADKIDRLIADLEEVPSQSGGANQLLASKEVESQKAGEFSHFTQGAAIVEALKKYGPQTTAELFLRLNASGQNFKKPSYVTALLPRLRTSGVFRQPDSRIAWGKVIAGSGRARQAGNDAESAAPRLPAI